MIVATWNVNSVRAREERLLAWLARHGPDVLCLQELKTEDAGFPHDRVRAAGYHAAVLGQRTYNGVAVLSRAAPTEIDRGLAFPDGTTDPQARYIAARIDGVWVVSVYVPNGQVVGSEKWGYKLAWLRQLRAQLERRFDRGTAVALCGDFNVAPDDLDVARPDEWRGTVLCHADARAAFAAVAAWGLCDVVRRHHPGGKQYSWWDYRGLGFQRNNGLRIDHVLATESLAARCTRAWIDRDERKGDKPSDHAPVVAEFAP
jgi:exodeoxyribonuclease-3